MKDEPLPPTHSFFTIESEQVGLSLGDVGPGPAVGSWEPLGLASLNNPEGARLAAEWLQREATGLGIRARLLPSTAGGEVLEIRSEGTSGRRATVECLPNGEITLSLWEGEQWKSRMEVGRGREEVRRRLRAANAFVNRRYDSLPEASISWRGAEETSLSSVWTLTTCSLDEGTGAVRLARRRTGGIFSALQSAHRVLQDNEMDLEEAGLYPYAFLEEVLVDRLYGVSPVRLWYCFDPDFEGYRPCEEPQGLGHHFPLGGVG